MSARSSVGTSTPKHTAATIEHLKTPLMSPPSLAPAWPLEQGVDRLMLLRIMKRAGQPPLAPLLGTAPGCCASCGPCRGFSRQRRRGRPAPPPESPSPPPSEPVPPPLPSQPSPPITRPTAQHDARVLYESKSAPVPPVAAAAGRRGSGSSSSSSPGSGGGSSTRKAPLTKAVKGDRLRGLGRSHGPQPASKPASSVRPLLLRPHAGLVLLAGGGAAATSSPWVWTVQGLDAQHVLPTPQAQALARTIFSVSRSRILLLLPLLLAVGRRLADWRLMWLLSVHNRFCSPPPPGPPSPRSGQAAVPEPGQPALRAARAGGVPAHRGGGAGPQQRGQEQPHQRTAARRQPARARIQDAGYGPSACMLLACSRHVDRLAPCPPFFPLLTAWTSLCVVSPSCDVGAARLHADHQLLYPTGAAALPRRLARLRVRKVRSIPDSCGRGRDRGRGLTA